MLSEILDEDDLRKLQQYQSDRAKEIIPDMHQQPDKHLWRELAEITLSRLLVFNACRGSEGAELTVVQYQSAASESDRPMSLTSTFTDVERQLLSR